MTGKIAVFITLGMLFFALLFFPPHADAGGCCFLLFHATNGTASEKDAVIDATFVDPKAMTQDKYEIKPLQNQKIIIHADTTRPDQGCRTEKDRTDDKGYIRATCTSAIPGTLSVWFSAPDLETKYSDMIGFVKQPIAFDGTLQPTAPLLSKAPILPTQQPKETAVVTVVVTQPPTQMTDNQDVKALEEKVQALEKEVASQRTQVNWLTSLIEGIRAMFPGLFGANKTEI